MGKFTVIACGVFCAITLSSCTPATNSKSSAPAATPQTTASTESNSSTATAPQNDVPNCDAYLQDMTDACIQIAIYDEQGNIRNDVDLNGNDLGPINKELATEYCQCFTKSAFQTFGCEAVMRDEALSRDEWVNKYTPLQQACVNDPDSVTATQMANDPEMTSDDQPDTSRPSSDEAQSESDQTMQITEPENNETPSEDRNATEPLANTPSL